MSDKLERMKETLMCAVEMELCNLAEADTEELGKVVDMIKDLEEAAYYCKVSKAMEEWEEKAEKHNENGQMYYPSPMMMYPQERIYYEDPRMYYNGQRGGNRGGGRSGGNETNSTDGRDNSRSYYNGSGGGSSGGQGGGGSGGQGGGGSSSGGSSGGGGGSSSQYSEREYPYEFRDYREGRSPRSRRMYMESKETHQDKAM